MPSLFAELTKTKVPKYLAIRQPMGKIDPMVLSASKTIGEKLLKKLEGTLSLEANPSYETIRKTLQILLLPHAPTINRVSKRLNTNTGIIENIPRLLLANSDVYMVILHRYFYPEGSVKPKLPDHPKITLEKVKEEINTMFLTMMQEFISEQSATIQDMVEEATKAEAKRAEAKQAKAKPAKAKPAKAKPAKAEPAKAKPREDENSKE